MSTLRVCRAEELPPGEHTVVSTENASVGVFNVDGEFYAVSNTCPHRGGPVCTGKVKGGLVGEWPGVGRRVEETFADEPAVTCPWHGWDFDMESGDHLGDDSIKVPTYDVVVKDATVFLEL